MQESAADSYVNETTIHGVREFRTFQSPLARAVWLLVFVASFSYMVYEVGQLVYQYKHTPEATRFRTERLESFPNLSICPWEFVNASRDHIGPYIPYAWRALRMLSNASTVFVDAVQNLSSTEWTKCTNNSFGNVPRPATMEELAAFFHGPAAPFASVTDLLEYISLDIDGFISADCPLCAEKPNVYRYVTSRGVCYVVTGGRLSKARLRTIPELSLRLDHAQIDAVIDSAYSWLNTTFFDEELEKRKKRDVASSVHAGHKDEEAAEAELAWFDMGDDIFGRTFTIYFGEEVSEFDSHNGIKIQAQRKAYQVFIKTVHRKLMPKLTPCLEHLEENSRDRFKPCDMVCWEQAARDTCEPNCQLYFGPFFDNGTQNNFCLWNTSGEFPWPDYGDQRCVSQAYRQQCGDQTISAGDCLSSCDYYVYEPSILTLDHENHRYTFLNIRPFHPEYIEVIQEIETYSIDELVSNVGGLIGLFCGASVLSVAHVLYFFCCLPLEKRHARRKVEKRSAQK